MRQSSLESAAIPLSEHDRLRGDGYCLEGTENEGIKKNMCFQAFTLVPTDQKAFSHFTPENAYTSIQLQYHSPCSLP